MIVPLGRALVDAELPVLREHQLSMWGYIVLTALVDEPVRSQATLARVVGADKTRIIGVLDELQHRGLIARTPDPTDRRVRLLSVTPAGRRLHDSVRAAIRRHEERLLAPLPARDRQGFLQALSMLAAMPREQVTGNGSPE